MSKKFIILSCYGHLTNRSLSIVANCSRSYVRNVLHDAGLPTIKKCIYK